ncbi:sulfatase-like hydrolase/transferase [Phytohabitans rumicis]|uniref:sulfatase-like hydrolase/transferase n=1 Tax=Phytohabitans rumicis TaxID=1076125 RepID=UPI001565468F|nr:sulfatase-like hydrolase/transferase [Phytohabitans rumicis]
MKRALVVLAAAVVGLAPVPVHGAAPARPNILLLVLDDARTGSTEVMTKTEDWLRGGGAYFPNAVATTPSCCPSRASLLSGRFTHNHGVTQQDAVGRYDHDRTLQHDLKAAGYGTAAVGKLFNNWRLSERPPHFDRWALTGGGYENARFVVDGRSRRAPYSTTFIGDQVNRYVDGFEADDARPWFVYAGFTAPHSPYTPQPKYAEREFPWSGNPAARETDRRDKPTWVRKYRVTEAEGRATRTAQLRTLLSVDDAVESVRQHLAARGELDNTLVVLVSDNGKFWASTGCPASSRRTSRRSPCRSTCGGRATCRPRPTGGWRPWSTSRPPCSRPSGWRRATRWTAAACSGRTAATGCCWSTGRTARTAASPPGRPRTPRGAGSTPSTTTAAAGGSTGSTTTSRPTRGNCPMCSATANRPTTRTWRRSPTPSPPSAAAPVPLAPRAGLSPGS